VKSSTKRIVLQLAILVFSITTIGVLNSKAQSDYMSNCFSQLQIQNYTKAIKYGKEAVIWQSNNIYSFICLGKAYLGVGDTKKAQESFQKAQEIAKSIAELALVSNLLGVTYTYQNNFNAAYLYYTKSLNFYKTLDNKPGIASQLNNIGQIYLVQENFDKAFDYFNQSLDIYKSLNNKIGQASVYSNLAVLYSDKKEFNKSVDYFNEAIELYESSGDFSSATIAKVNLGNIYRLSGNFSKAEIYLKKGLEALEGSENLYWVGRTYEYLGLLYLNKSDSEKASQYLKKSLDIYKKIHDDIDAKKVSKILYEINNKNSSKSSIQEIKFNINEFFKNVGACF
jgi:tetratricopeptide (TPR) repeat protein